MKTLHEVQQGSQEWLALRSDYFTASEAAAMMGTSPYMTRSELMRIKATGIEQEHDAFALQRFQDGHEAEAVARPLAESYLQEDLYPVTMSVEIDGLKLLASMDGLTMDESTGFECKLWSQKIEDMVERAEIADSHWPQLEQQLLVTGAERILFVGCDKQTIKGQLWYVSKPERRAAIIAGWKQFQTDLANYQHVEVIPAAVAAPIEGFGALVLNVEGRVLACNLDAFNSGARAFIERLPKANELTTDQHFADAEAATKACAEAEARIKAAKDAAMAQASDIDAVFRSVDHIAEEIRQARLALEKAVKARKESIRVEIMQSAQAKLADHVKNLNERIGWHNGCPIISPAAADFASAIKGKKTVASLRDACDTELARAKIAASELADRIETNRKAMGESDRLFPDFDRVCTKAPDDFANLVAARVQAQKDADAKREEAKRQAEEQRGKSAEATHAVPIMTVSPQAPMPSTSPNPVAHMKLGDINAAIAPLTITASGLAQLGFESVGRERTSTLYPANALPNILAKIIRHLQTANMRKAA